MCALSGNECVSSCPKLHESKGMCEYKYTQTFAYTLGLVYVMLKVNMTSTVYERDFMMVIHTGKRYTDLLEEWEPYDLYEPADFTSIDEVTQPIDTVDLEDKYKNIRNILIPEINRKRDKNLEGVEKLIESFKKTKGKVPHHLIQMKNNLLKKVKSVKDLKAGEILDYIFRYIKTGEGSIAVIRELCEYFILDFVPVDKSDFPYSELRSVDEYTQGTSVQKYLDDENPYKWTSERLEQYRKESDPYKKFVISSPTLYTWKLYIFPDQVQMEHKHIRAKYLLDHVVGNFARFATMYYLILSHMEFPEALRLTRVVRAITRVIKQKLNMKLHGFFTETFLTHQAMFMKGIDHGEYFQIMRNLKPESMVPDDADELFDILLQKNWIRKFTLIK